MKLIYIAHPLRSEDEYGELNNVFKATKFAALVNIAGKCEWSAVSVLNMNNLIEQTMQDIGSSLSEEYWYDATLTLMLKCDAVLFCYGWEKSEGCNQEFEVAVENKISFYAGVSENPDVEEIRQILEALK